MMAGIGDYIHYKQSNYIKFGTTKDSIDHSSAQEIFSEQRKALKQFIAKNNSTTDTSQIESFLNNLMYGTDGIDQATKKAYEELKVRISDVVAEKYANFGVNFGKENDQSMNIYYTPPTETTKNQASISTLKKYLSTIFNMINGSLGVMDKADMGKLNEVYQTLKQTINAMESQGETTIKWKNNQTLKEDINTALAWQSIPIKNALGDVFEWWLALASQLGEDLSNKTTDEILEEFVKGSSGSNKQISMDNFSSDYVDGKLLWESGAFKKGWTPINDYTAFQFDKKSQDKLDVIFNWEGDQTPLYVSAKNYKLENPQDLIHLVSGTSLLMLIQNEPADFVNHWLNCVSSIANGTDVLPASILQQAHFMMKFTLFVQALAGKDQSQSVNTLIVNNRTKQHIYVKSMEQILNQISEETASFMRISGYPQKVQQFWVGDERQDEEMAKRRISKLIADLHTYQLNISMSPKVLT